MQDSPGHMLFVSCAYSNIAHPQVGPTSRNYLTSLTVPKLACLFSAWVVAFDSANSV